MYNEELKNKFIESYTESVNSIRSCRDLFNVLEKYENEWGADICTRSEDELRDVLESIVGFRISSHHMRLLILKRYAKWCLEQNIPGACDALLRIKIDGIERFRNSTVASPLGLQMYLDTLFRKETDQGTDSILRCYLWLAYGGATEKEIVNIRKEDVHLDLMEVVYNDKVIPIYREALPAFKCCLRLNEMKVLRNGFAAVYQRADGDILLRTIKDAHPTSASLKAHLSTVAKRRIDEGKTTTRLSYYKAWLSGVFYRMYELERVGIKPDFTKLAEQQAEGKEYKLKGSRNTREAKIRQIAREYMDDYERWKYIWK